MTNDQIDKLRSTLVSLFGEAIVEPDDESESLYVESKRAAVMIVRDVMDVDSILGERQIPCWSVGTLDDEGEFSMIDQSDSFWGITAKAASIITRTAVAALQFDEYVSQLKQEAEQQYE
jgi:hypothetical protein